MTDALLASIRAAGVLAVFAALGYALYRVLRFVLSQWVRRQSATAVQARLPSRTFTPRASSTDGWPVECRLLRRSRRPPRSGPQ